MKDIVVSNSGIREADRIARERWYGFTLTQLDTWSGTMATVVAPPSGEIPETGPYAPMYYHPDTGTYKDTPPTDVQVGQTVGFYAYGRNTGSTPETFRIVGRILDPDGNEVASGENEGRLPPDYYIGLPAITTAAKKAGKYTAEVVLYLVE